MMRRAARLAALAGLLLVAAVALQLGDHDTQPPPVGRSTPTPPAAAPPEPLTAVEINRQDRRTRAQRRRETRAFDRRPLLAVLPIELAGVRIDVHGLAPDARTTILAVTAGPRGRAYARRFYQRALAAYADPGTAYTTRWATP